MHQTLRLAMAQNIPGWMSDEELTFLAGIASKSETIFEIGSYQGRSTRAIADNAPEKARIFAIDPWNFSIQRLIKSDDITFNQFCCNLNDHIASGKLIVCPTTWNLYKPELIADFIFIDGDHRYDAVKHDIEKAMKYLRPGSIIAGHDYRPEWPGVIQAVDEQFPKDKLNNTDSIWWLEV